jgi:hypothetical protein
MRRSSVRVGPVAPKPETLFPVFIFAINAVQYVEILSHKKVNINEKIIHKEIAKTAGEKSPAVLLGV